MRGYASVRPGGRFQTRSTAISGPWYRRARIGGSPWQNVHIRLEAYPDDPNPTIPKQATACGQCIANSKSERSCARTSQSAPGEVLGGPVRPIDLRPSTYDVRWDDQTYDATNVPEDELESE